MEGRSRAQRSWRPLAHGLPAGRRWRSIDVDGDGSIDIKEFADVCFPDADVGLVDAAAADIANAEGEGDEGDADEGGGGAARRATEVGHPPQRRGGSRAGQAEEGGARIRSPAGTSSTVHG